MKKLIVSFPVINAAPWIPDGQGRAILLKMQPIAPARPDLAPSHCRVTAILETGAIPQFTIPISVWNDAIRAPVFFVEGTDVRGPNAATETVTPGPPT